MLRTRRPLLALLVLAVLLAGGYLVSAVRSDTAGPATGSSLATAGQTARPTAAPTTARTGVPTTARTGATGSGPSTRDGLRVVAASTLPAAARRTLTLIESGGPFPYDRDGVVFGNNERLLPRRDRGWYREYTVPTPGESDRGARRIVAGRDGARYYTADHYDSFVRVDPGR